MVRDTGMGIAPAARAHIFDPYFTTKGQGTGLGLAISRALAEAMGGGLDAQSTPGAGSRFTLTVALPAWAGDLPESDRQATPALGEDRAPRVLLAEDHPINRKVVELLFEGTGVDLTSVENGAEAVAAAAGGRFDLILMDMQMPVMDGLTAIRAIRAAEAAGDRPPTPIWALSANALPEHSAASIAAGADGHLSKPISAEALFSVVAQACEQAESSGLALTA